MITYIEYDEFHNDYYLILPDEMLKQLGWEVGDVLIWTIYEDKVGLRKYEPANTLGSQESTLTIKGNSDER